jgi:hypothetical protein
MGVRDPTHPAAEVILSASCHLARTVAGENLVTDTIKPAL